jgi:predicted enzyme related to lactoylglutathione lyase
MGRVTEVASIVLLTEHPEQTVAFYRALGIPLSDEDHGDGVAHAAADVGGVHVAVIASSVPGNSPGWHVGGSTFVGFWVPSLENVRTDVEALGASVLLDHQTCEWGCRVVVADPDGRAVELNQRDHCQEP